VLWRLRPVRGVGILARRDDRERMRCRWCRGCFGDNRGGERLGSWRTPARLEGQHGAEQDLAVLFRRRAPHRAGQHACRTSILPRAAFVYAGSAMIGRSLRGLAACSCACGAAARSSCAAAAIAGRSTATVIAPHMRAVRRCTRRANAGSEPRGVGGCMPPGWSGIGRSWPKVPPASPLECRMGAATRNSDASRFPAPGDG
jgi:hypothetical protein